MKSKNNHITAALKDENMVGLLGVERVITWRSSKRENYNPMNY